MRTLSGNWLQKYYFVRFAFSAIWVAAAFAVGRLSIPVAALMFIAYPAWDALANYFDAMQSGGLAENPTQTLNFAISALTTIAAAVALKAGTASVLDVFGIWAALAGALQLSTAIRRSKSQRAQWTMIISGAQSVLAGAFFVKMAQSAIVPSVTIFAPYVAFGALYFLISAIWLSSSNLRKTVV